MHGSTTAPTRRGVHPLRSIRLRIVAAFFATILLTLGAMGFLVAEYRGVSHSQALVTEGYLPLAQDVHALRVYQQRIDTDVERLGRGDIRPGIGAASTASIYTDALRSSIAEATHNARRARAMTTQAEEVAVLNKVTTQLELIQELFQQYHDRVSQLVALAESQRRSEAEALQPAIRNDAARLGAEIDKLTRQVEGRITHLTRITEEQRTKAAAVAGFMAAVATGVSLSLVFAVLWALRPITKLTDQIQRLAGGDYSGRVEVRGADEIALLAGEFNAMATALQTRDRTLVERAEQLNRLSRYLGSVLDSLEDALFVVEDGRISLTNPAARRIWDATQNAPPPAPLAPLLSVLGDHELAHPDGSLHEVRVTPFGEGGFIVVSADVTERRRAEERLARSERLAMIGQMLAQITHEVRNPLNALSLNAELLADELGALDPERRTEAWDLLDTVSTEIDRLTEVTAHYLQLARRPPARLEPEELAGICQDVARLLAAELDRAGVELRLEMTPITAQLVDGNQLRQALLNVLRNATQAGARHLTVSLSATGGEVLLTVADDGPGMTREQVERATDPFFSTKPSGTGLGLAITRQILEDHDGAVRVESTPGRGTLLTLALPWRPAPDRDLLDHTGSP